MEKHFFRGATTIKSTQARTVKCKLQTEKLSLLYGTESYVIPQRSYFLHVFKSNQTY